MRSICSARSSCSRARSARRSACSAPRSRPIRRAAGAWCNLGQALHALKRAPDALDCLDKARALAPDDMAILNQHANVLVTLGRPDEALAEFRQVLARLPNHVEARLNCGLAQAMLGFPEQALADFDTAVQFAPGHPGVALQPRRRAAETRPLRRSGRGQRPRACHRAGPCRRLAQLRQSAAAAQSARRGDRRL